MNRREGISDETRQLFKALVAKLEANLEILQKSVHQGQLTWRKKKEKGFEIRLKPDI